MSSFMTGPRIARALVASVLAALTLLSSPSFASAAYVYIDPGHGGRYDHARAYGIYEKTVNLQIGLELRKQLQARGHKVGMTRTSDVAVQLADVPTWNWSSSTGWRFEKDGKRYGDPPKDDLQGRVDRANRAGADLFVSIHNNGGPRSARGTETYADDDDPLGRKLAAYVQNAVVEQVGTRNRGAKETGFYVVRWSNMPAILVECAFVSNPYDAAMLKNAAYRVRFARGVAIGIARFLNTNPYKALYPRITGTDRYALAAAASKSAWPTGAETVLIAAGDRAKWPDAVTAAPLSRKLDAPILLTAPGSLPLPTKRELARLAPKRIIVLGGTASVPEAVAASAASAAGVAPEDVTRLAGADRYETSVAIAREVGFESTTTAITVVSGRTFLDALSVSPYAGMRKYPMVLSDNATLPRVTRDYLRASADPMRPLVEVGASTSIPSAATPGFRFIKRVKGYDTARTNVAVLDTWYKSTTSPLVASSNAFSDSLVAGAYGAKTGRPLVLVAGRSMSPYTRQWILRNAHRIEKPTILGGTATIPTLMDWVWLKARDGQ